MGINKKARLPALVQEALRCTLERRPVRPKSGHAVREELGGAPGVLPERVKSDLFAPGADTPFGKNSRGPLEFFPNA